MESEEQRALIFRELLEPLAIRYGAFEASRWFMLGVSLNKSLKSMRSAMNAKCRPPGAKARKGVTYADALAIQLLHFLDHEKYLLNRMTFDGKGHLKSISKSPTSKMPDDLDTGADVESRAALFSLVLPELADRYGAFEVARWFLLGKDGSTDKQSMRSAMNQKCRPMGAKARRGVTYADALAIQLLAFLDKKGYDLGSMRFNNEGRLLSIDKRPVKSE